MDDTVSCYEIDGLSTSTWQSYTFIVFWKIQIRLVYFYKGKVIFDSMNVLIVLVGIYNVVYEKRSLSVDNSYTGKKERFYWRIKQCHHYTKQGPLYGTIRFGECLKDKGRRSLTWSPFVQRVKTGDFKLLLRRLSKDPFWKKGPSSVRVFFRVKVDGEGKKETNDGTLPTTNFDYVGKLWCS